MLRRRSALAPNVVSFRSRCRIRGARQVIADAFRAGDEPSNPKGQGGASRFRPRRARPLCQIPHRNRALADVPRMRHRSHPSRPQMSSARAVRQSEALPASGPARGCSRRALERPAHSSSDARCAPASRARHVDRLLTQAHRLRPLGSTDVAPRSSPMYRPTPRHRLRLFLGAPQERMQGTGHAAFTPPLARRSRRASPCRGSCRRCRTDPTPVHRAPRVTARCGRAPSARK